MLANDLTTRPIYRQNQEIVSNSLARLAEQLNAQNEMHAGFARLLNEQIGDAIEQRNGFFGALPDLANTQNNPHNQADIEPIRLAVCSSQPGWTRLSG